MHTGVSFALCTSSLTSLVHEGESEGQEQPASPRAAKFAQWAYPGMPRAISAADLQCYRAFQCAAVAKAQLPRDRRFVA